MSSIENPSHSLPDEVSIGFRKLQQAEIEIEARQDEIAKLARANEEERRLIVEVQESVAESRGINREMLERLRYIRTRKFERVREVLDREIAIVNPFEFYPLDLEPPQPEPSDPTFWWARTDWWHPEHFRADTRSDGLHFLGGVTTHDGSLYKDSFGAVALFELQASRIPRSQSGRWLSTPHVELFGGLLGYTGNDDILTGDLWSKCWMHRDQQLFQWGFGPSGPVPIVLGQAHESETLIFEENKDRSVRVGLRGYQWMPPVTFSNINLANSVWARIEVRFDIQTEGAGTLLWLDPEVLLRTFQWPLTAL